MRISFILMCLCLSLAHPSEAGEPWDFIEQQEQKNLLAKFRTYKASFKKQKFNSQAAPAPELTTSLLQETINILTGYHGYFECTQNKERALFLFNEIYERRHFIALKISEASFDATIDFLRKQKLIVCRWELNPSRIGIFLAKDSILEHAHILFTNNQVTVKQERQSNLPAELQQFFLRYESLEEMLWRRKLMTEQEQEKYDWDALMHEYDELALLFSPADEDQLTASLEDQIQPVNPNNAHFIVYEDTSEPQTKKNRSQ